MTGRLVQRLVSKTRDGVAPGCPPAATSSPDSSRALLYSVGLLFGLSLGGAEISVRNGLSATHLQAVGSKGYLSVPLPMTAFLVLTAAGAGSRRRAVALPASGLLGLAVTLAVVSGFFDGGYSDPRLGRLQRSYQMLLVGNLCVVGILSVDRLQRVWRNGTSSAKV
jgi:hypothetical protein